MNDAVSIQNVSKSYYQKNDKNTIFNGFSTIIKKKEMTSIIGPSGSGKSTLLRMMCGIDRNYDGNIFLLGKNLQEASDKQLRRHRLDNIGFIFQDYKLLPYLSVIENVLLPITLQNGSSYFLRDEAKKLLQLVKMDHKVSARPTNLSGGEQQRVAIARALITSPSVMFCDEPTGNLNRELSNEIINLLMLAKNELNSTIVIVTHSESVADVSDRVIDLALNAD